MLRETCHWFTSWSTYSLPDLRLELSWEDLLLISKTTMSWYTHHPSLSPVLFLVSYPGTNKTRVQCYENNKGYTLSTYVTGDWKFIQYLGIRECVLQKLPSTPLPTEEGRRNVVERCPVQSPPPDTIHLSLFPLFLYRLWYLLFNPYFWLSQTTSRVWTFNPHTQNWGLTGEDLTYSTNWYETEVNK